MTDIDSNFIREIKKLNGTIVENAYTTQNLHGLGYRITFPNGYGASMVKQPYSYGGKDDLWEIVVLKNGYFCYTTPVTNDAIGFLDNDEALETCQDIAALPKAEIE